MVASGCRVAVIGGAGIVVVAIQRCSPRANSALAAIAHSAGIAVIAGCSIRLIGNGTYTG
jgi:hypothetical protein